MDKFIGLWMYSGIWITLILNPMQWRFNWNMFQQSLYTGQPDELNIQAGFICIRIIVDDGSGEVRGLEPEVEFTPEEGDDKEK